jgi:hypothetical protein
MKKLLLVLLVVAIGGVLLAQNNIFSPGLFNPSDNGNALINPFKLKMRHSMGFSAGSSSTGAGFYESRYTNHISYMFNPKLNLEMDLNFVNYGSTSMNKSFDFSTNDDNKSRIIPEFSLTYKPTDSIIMQVEYRNMHNPYTWAGRNPAWME